MKNYAIINRNADELILRALSEDIPNEDITTNAIIREYKRGNVELICKQDGVVAGLDVFKRVFELMDDSAEFEVYFKDGDSIKNTDIIAMITADLGAILSAERTALNFLQRMSGIATMTKRVAALLENTEIKLVDTRKTTPNMRVFEKYAVKVGGGYNHRCNLSDGVLIKDNHIAAAGGIKKAIEAVRGYNSFIRKIEIEVENLDMVREALDAGADIIMLDNMDSETMKKASEIIDGRAEIEISGNITQENINAIKNCGANYISCGALTHSAPILDFSLKNLKAI